MKLTSAIGTGIFPVYCGLVLLNGQSLFYHVSWKKVDTLTGAAYIVPCAEANSECTSVKEEYMIG